MSVKGTPLMLVTEEFTGYPNSGNPPSGGGGGNGMESRVAVLEASLGHIKTDIADIKTDIRVMRTDNKAMSDKLDSRVIWLLTVIAASTIGLASLMAKGFHWF